MRSETKQLIQFDWAMKTLLRREENFPILEGLLSELLKTDVKIQSLLESESNRRFENDKSNRVDIFAKLGNEEKVIIELQADREWDFLSRMLYGVSRVVVDHLKKGDRYKEIPRIISVNIVYFDLGRGRDYIYRGTTEFKGIHKKDQLQLTQKERDHYPPHVGRIENIFPEYYILKVSGFDLMVKDTLDEWVYALKESEVKPEFKAKGIREAGQALTRLNLSEKELQAYERYLDDVRISRSTLETAFGDGVWEGKKLGREEGEAAGRQAGRIEAKKEIILSMHHSQLPLKQIAAIAKVSLEEVKKLLEQR